MRENGEKIVRWNFDDVNKLVGVTAVKHTLDGCKLDPETSLANCGLLYYTYTTQLGQSLIYCVSPMLFHSTVPCKQLPDHCFC